MAQVEDVIREAKAEILGRVAVDSLTPVGEEIERSIRLAWREAYSNGYDDAQYDAQRGMFGDIT